MSPLNAHNDNLVAGVCSLLRVTLSGQHDVERKEAERQLENLSSRPDFVPILLRIISGQANENQSENGDRTSVGFTLSGNAIRQSATIYLKHCVMKRWPPAWENEPQESFSTNSTASTNTYFDVDTCILLQENLLPLYMASSALDRKQLAACLSVMVDGKTSNRWPALLPTLASLLQGAAQTVSLDALQAVLDLLLVVARAQVTISENEDDIMGTRIVPYLADLLPPILNELSQKCGEPRTSADPAAIQFCSIVKQVLKIWVTMAKYTLPNSFQNTNFLDIWINYIHQILALATPQRLLKDLESVMNARKSVEDDADLNKEDDIDSSEDEFEGDPFWGMKKWALHMTVLLVQRYGVKGGQRIHSKKVEASFHTRLITHYAPTLVTSCLQMVAGVSSGNLSGWLPSRCICLLCDILGAAVTLKSLYKATLKSHIPALLHAFILPRLAISKLELMGWRQDARAYAQRRTDPFQQSEANEDGGIQEAITTLLLALVTKRCSTVLPLLLSHLSTLFNQPASNSNQFYERQKKDGALHLIGILSDFLQETETEQNKGHSKKEVALSPDALAHLLQVYILPELQLQPNLDDVKYTNLPFVTLRGVWLLTQLDVTVLPPMLQVQLFERLLMILLHFTSSQNQVNNEANLVGEKVPGVVQNTRQSSTDWMLPVALQAAIALPAFISLETVRPILVSQMGPLLQGLLSLSHLVEADDVASVLSHLVDAHPEAIAPYAVALTEALTHPLMRLLMDPLLAPTATEESPSQSMMAEGFNASDDLADSQWEATTNKLMAACGLFKTLHTLIMAMATSPPEVLVKLESLLLTPTSYVLQHAQKDLFDDTFALLDAITFVRKTLSSEMWQILHLVMAHFLKDPTWREYLDVMASFFENAISYGLPVMLAEKVAIYAENEGKDAHGQLVHASLGQRQGLLDMMDAVLRLTHQSSDEVGVELEQTSCHLITIFFLYAWQLDQSSSDASARVYHSLLASSYLPRYIALLTPDVKEQKGDKMGNQEPCEYEWVSSGAPSIVSNLSILLSALLYDMSATMQAIPAAHLTTLLEILYARYKLFKRVQDKKLLVLVMLEAPYNLLTPCRRIEILTFALETLPKAIVDRKALEDGLGDSDEDSDYYDDDDDDEYEEDSEEEETSNGMVGKKQVGVGMASTQDSAIHTDDGDDDDGATEGSEGGSWYEACLEEDLYSETPLDTIDVVQCVRQGLSLTQQQQQHPLYLSLQNVTLEKQQALLKALEQK